MTKREILEIMINEVKRDIYFNERADNFYYSSGRYAKDKERLEELEKQLRKEKDN